jgi:calcineurin-like phosphoesterase family protein
VVLEDVDVNADGRGVPAMLCHYPILSFDRQHYRAYNFFGHSHNKLIKRKNCLDVGVDSAYELLGEYRPFSLNETIHISRSFDNLVALDTI